MTLQATTALERTGTEVNNWNRLKTLVLLLFLFPAGSRAQASLGSETPHPEQSEFSADPSERVKASIDVPDSVLKILAKDAIVTDCMKDNPIAPGGSLAAWFTASTIHLGEPNEADLVVLPTAQGNAYMCFHSVEGVGWFWVFRPIGEQYGLLLKTAALGLSVLDTRHNGYRDIRSGSQVGKWSTIAVFQFEGGHYRESEKKTKELR
jgi:hypothetical protein